MRIDALNLRAGPDVLHPVIDVIGRRTPVAIEGRDHSAAWYAVRLKNRNRGWISSDYVSLRRDESGIPTAITPTPPPTPTTTPIPMDPSLPLIAVPPSVGQGDPFLVRVRAQEASQVVAVFDGLDVHLQGLGDGRFAALLAAGLESNPGEQPVHISIIDRDGNVRNERLGIRIQSGGYPMESIQLDETLLGTLDPAAAEAETARLAEIWQPVTPEQLAPGRWIEPVTGTISSHFGGIRDYNFGFLKARHTGLDLRGRTGTPVRAPARGRVVLAEALQIRGNCVWLDHGWGVYSGYFHLSEMKVAVGDLVEQGALLGAVGTTGRSTAPHLHWELRVRGRAASPIQWLGREVGFVP